MGQLALSLRSATQRCLVGRHPDCAVHLEHLSVSRHHAELTLDHAGNLFLTDLGAGPGSPVMPCCARLLTSCLDCREYAIMTASTACIFQCLGMKNICDLVAGRRHLCFEF